MIPETVILSTVGLLLLFYYFCIKPLTYWSEAGVKQTRPKWLFGDMMKTTLGTQTFTDWLVEIYETFPNERYFGFYQFTRPMLMVRDPDLIKKICVSDFDHFGDHRTMISEKIDPLWANNLFALKGKRWRNSRPILTSAFTSSKMRSMFELMSKPGEQFVDFYLERPDDIIEIECKDIFSRYCSDVIATTAFGIETDSFKQPNNEFYRLGLETIRSTKGWKFLFILCAPKLAEVLKIRLFGPEIGKYYNKLVDDSIKTRVEKNIIRPDLIHLLMKASLEGENESNIVNSEYSTVQGACQGKIGPKKITNSEIASHAMVFLNGGLDSISSMMSFLAYELAFNPDVQERLRKEIEETFEMCEGRLTYDVLLQMKYMDMVVAETLRRWPNGPSIDRECTKDYTIEPVENGESPVYLKKGDNVWFPVYAIHLDEKFYPSPKRFDPERFNDENRKSINPSTYLPFGAGPRNCLASRYSLLVAKVLMFHLLHHFELIPTQKSSVPLILSHSPFQISPEGGFHLGLRRINKYLET